MAKEILLEREGQVKTSLVGFSWTYFFFGFFVPLFRGDFLAALVLFVVTALLSGVAYGSQNPALTSITSIFNLIIAFGYNKYYTTNLLKKGFRPADYSSKELLNEYNIFY